MKKNILIALVLVLVVGLLLSLMPWSRNISVETTVYEYALDQELPLEIHEVTITGRYYYGIWKDPYFDGTFAVTGFPFSKEESARITFRQEYGTMAMVFYRDWAGQPYTSELGQLYCLRDFSEFAILVYEQNVDGDRKTSLWDPENGHVLCTNAPNYEELKNQCEALGFRFWEM